MSLAQSAIDALLNDSGSARQAEQGTAATSASTAPDKSAGEAKGAESPLELERILNLQVPVSVTLADREMTIKSILEIAVGTIIEFDVPFDAELSLYIANRKIGLGLAVKIGEKFGLRLTKVNTVEERIDALGGS